MTPILVVESNVPVRCLLEVICEHLGHEPVSWEGGPAITGAGLGLVIAEPAEPEALRIVRELRATQPELPIVFVSSLPPTAETRALEPRAHVLKPASLAGIEAAIIAGLGSLDSETALGATRLPELGFPSRHK